MSPTTKQNENGMTYATLVVSIVSGIVLILVITFFLWSIQKQNAENMLLLHKSEEAAAYKYSWLKNQYNLMKQKCDSKLVKLGDWEKWAETYPKAKPPFDLLSNKGDCAVNLEMPEKEQEPKGE